MKALRKMIVFAFVGSLWILAIIPWLYSGCNTQSLVPDDLVQAPVLYHQTVTAAQGATISAMRDATSVLNVVPIGTLPTHSESIEVSGLVASTSNVTVSTVTASATTQAGVESPTGVQTDTPTTNNTVTPEPVPSETINVDQLPATPSGLIDTEDLITELEFTEQLNSEAEGSNLKDLTVHIHPDGFRIDGAWSSSVGSSQPVVVDGMIVVENYGLEVDIASILLDGIDVTSQYRNQVESRMNSSLYRLLPERYVQRFVLADGEILVFSKMRP